MRYYVEPTEDPNYKGHVDTHISYPFYMTDIGVVYVFMFGMEGEALPHIHLKDQNLDDICKIELCDNKYYGDNNHYLNSQQCLELNNWFKSLSERVPEALHWRSLITSWNGFEGNYTTDEYRIGTMPDYTNIKEQ